MTRYRVEFGLLCAGGRVIRTWSEVDAASPETAIAVVRRSERCALFHNATVTPVTTEPAQEEN